LGASAATGFARCSGVACARLRGCEKIPFAANPNRPNGPGEPSPGLRPQADALGKQAKHPCGLKGRETLPATLSRPCRTLCCDDASFPRASLRSALGSVLPARWAGWWPPAERDFFTSSEPSIAALSQKSTALDQRSTRPAQTSAAGTERSSHPRGCFSDPFKRSFGPNEHSQ
jgi:hypothetical protein